MQKGVVNRYMWAPIGMSENCNMGNSGTARIFLFVLYFLVRAQVTPRSVIVPQYGSSKITVFVWGKNTILKFVGKVNETYSAVSCCFP